MAKNISWLGASYSDVGYITLPKTGGGSARFDDVSVTTATAADVAANKIFVATDGTVTTGTASGGASNFVTGTFTADSGTGAAHSVTIPYTGTGFPLAAMVFIAGGAYESGTTWYNSTQRYAVGQWTFSKSVQSTTPTYTTSGAANQGVTTWVFKNSTSTATTYSRSSAMNTNVLTSSNATGAGATCCRFKGKTTLSYYTASTSYGLLAGQEYRYVIMYSS